MWGSEVLGVRSLSGAGRAAGFEGSPRPAPPPAAPGRCLRSLARNRTGRGWSPTEPSRGRLGLVRSGPGGPGGGTLLSRRRGARGSGDAAAGSEPLCSRGQGGGGRRHPKGRFRSRGPVPGLQEPRPLCLWSPCRDPRAQCGDCSSSAGTRCESVHSDK